MALFNDGPVSTIDDLTAYDSSLLDVANTEGIDLTRKLSVVQDEVGVVLSTLLPEEQNCGISNLVVTTPLRIWHTLRTLAIVYQDAYYSQLNDRYQAKWKAYAERAHWAQEKLMQAGVGFVNDPLPQATPPALEAVPFAQPAATYFIGVTWVNGSGAEGRPSEWRSLTMDAGNTIQVTPPAAPANATGWNVYAGYDIESASLQNDAPLELDEAWVFTDAVPAAGKLPGAGQQPDFLRALPRILQRG